MKTSYIGLILAPVFLFADSATSQNMSIVAKPDLAPLNSLPPDNFDQYRISLEFGLQYHDPELLPGLEPHQSTIAVSSLNYRGFDSIQGHMILLDATGTNHFEQNQADLLNEADLLKTFFSNYGTNLVFCHTNLVFNGSPPPQLRESVSLINYSSLDCRGRDMSLIDDTAAK